MPVPRHRADVGSPRSGGEVRPGEASELKGVVTKVEWLNPHVQFSSTREGTKPARTGRSSSKAPLTSNGAAGPATRSRWAMRSRCEGIAARDGSTTAWGNSVVVAATGREGVHGHSSRAARVHAARTGATLAERTTEIGSAPRPDHGLLGLSERDHPGRAGRHRFRPTRHGMLRNIADIDKVAPFQRWARDLYELRQRNFLKDDPMFIFCKPQAGPRSFSSRTAFSFWRNGTISGSG